MNDLIQFAICYVCKWNGQRWQVRAGEEFYGTRSIAFYKADKVAKRAKSPVKIIEVCGGEQTRWVPGDRAQVDQLSRKSNLRLMFAAERRLRFMLAAERRDANFHPSVVGINGADRIRLLKVAIWLESTRSIEGCVEYANRDLKAAA